MVSCCAYGIAAQDVVLDVPSAGNCGNNTSLVCRYSDGRTIGIHWGFKASGSPIANQFSIVDTTKYSITTTSTSVTLGILNTELADSQSYDCNQGFSQSSTITLLYQCKATSATTSHRVLLSKKLQITSDELYPVLQNNDVSVTFNQQSTAIPGFATCTNSPTYTNHYRCVWTFSSSVSDGTYTYSLVVTTVTASDPITVSFTIATPGTPVVSNVVTAGGRTNAVRGTQGQLLSLTCTSSGGFPVQTVDWYKGNISTSNKLTSQRLVTVANGLYTVTRAYTFTPMRSQDLDTFICASSYPEADSGQRGLMTRSVVIYLNLQCSNPVVTQRSAVTAGGTVKMVCTVSDCRPAPSITWSNATSGTSTQTQSRNSSTETYSVESVYRRQVTAAANGDSITCIVAHRTETDLPTLTTSGTISVSFSAASTTIAGNITPFTVGDGATMALTCTTGSSYPASDITWGINGVAVTSNGQYTEVGGDNKGVVRSQVQEFTPTRDMDTRSVTCSASNTVNPQSPVTSAVTMDLRYRPEINVMSNLAVVVGTPDVKLTCSASSNPAASFTWSTEGSNPAILESSTGTAANNGILYTIPTLERQHAGTYYCEADNNIGERDRQSLQLTVQYPPHVTIITTNTTVAAMSMSLLCNAEGVPAIYSYGSWTQTWSGNQHIRSWPSSGAQLNLSRLTYEHSGFYTCSASNGKRVYGTADEYMRSTTYVRVKSFPVVTRPSVEDSNTLNVYASLGESAVATINFYSNTDDEAEVSLHKTSESEKRNIGVQTTATDVYLKVFTTTVTVTGTSATISFTIRSTDDFTEYDVIVKNEIGMSSFRIVVIPDGPPEAPTLVNVWSIQFTSAVVLWTEGLHGGHIQTCVIQHSIDGVGWNNATSLVDDSDENETGIQSATINGLSENTMYFVRMFSYNEKGRSESFSDTFSLTTKERYVSEYEPTDSSKTTTIAAGIVGGVVALIIAGVVTLILLQRRYSMSCIPKQDSGTDRTHEGPSARSDENFTALDTLKGAATGTEHTTLESATGGVAGSSTACYEQGEGAGYEQLEDPTYEQLQCPAYEVVEGTAYEHIVPTPTTQINQSLTNTYQNT